MNKESNEIFLSVMAGIYFPDKTYVPNETAMQRIQYLTTAEIAAHRTICDPQTRSALYAPQNWYDFFVRNANTIIGLRPDDFIPFGEDTEIEVSLMRWNSQKGGNVFTPEELGLDASNLQQNQLFYWSRRPNPDISNLPCALGKYNLNKITNIQPSGSEPYFPQLTLLAIKLTAIRKRIYSPDMVAAELFERGFAKRPELLLAPMHGLPEEYWIETLSEPYTPSKTKLGYTSIEYFHDPNTALSMRVLGFEDAEGSTYDYPVLYSQHKYWNYPTSFLSPPSCKMPLNRPKIEDGTPIVVTEFSNIASINGDNKKIAVVSWFGGEAGISRTNLNPLDGKSFYYLLQKADNDKDGKRAVKVMFKFLSTLKSQGVFHFKILDTIYHDIIDEKRLGLLYKRYQVEIPDDLVGENCGIELNWRPPTTVGSTILGQSVQEGRIHQIHGPSGTGKSLIVQFVANTLIRGEAPDFGEPLASQPGRQFKILYVQIEMQEGDVPHDDMQARQKRFDRLFGKPLSKDRLIYYKPTGDICKLSEQEAIVSKLAELDPEGMFSWVIILDNILSLMPSATNKSGYDKIKPWFEALKALGITIFLVHHDSKSGNDGYGTSTILNHMDSSWQITLTDQARDKIIQALPSGIRNDLAAYGKLQDADEALARMNSAVRKVYFTVDKGRHCDMKPFFIQWTITDTEQNLKAEYSDYSDLEALVKKMLLEYKTKLECVGEENDDVPNCEINGTVAPSDVITAESNTNGSSGEQACNPVRVYAGALPTTFAALKGLDKATQRLALLGLRLKHGSIKAVSSALDCSESSIEVLCREHGINKKSVEIYASLKDAKI